MRPSEQDVFEEALALRDPRERAVYLARICQGDEPLRLRVESLLAAYHSGEFLESPAAAVGDLGRAWREASLVGTNIGGYAILELIGEGGMGDVYLARRAGERQSVALKVIKPGMDSRQVLARFQLERAAMARMDHPHIAQFIEAGVTDQGRAYFAMELVQGLPITSYCDRQRLPVMSRLKLMIDLCLAVQHAHSKGLIHRDLKPSNVLVTEIDGEPVVKVIDFGVAKALDSELSDRTIFTRASQLIGTPLYMSPEQVRWCPSVDARSDVYSLGVLLYELLTGVLPFAQEAIHQIGFDEFRRVVQEDEPPKPSQRLTALADDITTSLATARGVSAKQLLSQLRGDLDWIALMALAKDPARRYANPGELAEDLNRFLAHRVIRARAPHPLARARKWARRRAALLRRVLMVVTIVVVASASYWAMTVHRHGRASVALAERTSRHARYCNDVQVAWMRVLAGDRPGALALLGKHGPGSPGGEQPGFEWRLIHALAAAKPQLRFEGLTSGVLSADLSPDERWAAAGDRSGALIVWDARTGHRVHGAQSAGGEVTTVKFSPDGKWLAWAGQDRAVHLCNTGSWEEIHRFEKSAMTISAVAWSPDGNGLAAAARDGNVQIWDVVNAKHLATLTGHVDAVRCVAWSPDGRHVATSNGTLGLFLWDATTWERRAEIQGSQTGTLAMAFSPDSARLAFGGYGSVLSVALVEQPSNVMRISAVEQIWSLAYLSDNRILAGLGGGNVQLFRVINKRPPKPSQLNSEWVAAFDQRGTHRAVVPATDGDAFLLAREEDGAVELVGTGDVLGFQARPMDAYATGAAGGFLLTRDPGTGAAFVRNMKNGDAHPLAVDPPHTCEPAYSAETETFAVYGADSAVHFFSSKDWRLKKRVEVAHAPVEMSFSRDGRFLALGSGPAPWIIDLVDDTLRPLSHTTEFAVLVQFSPTDDLLVLGDFGQKRLTLLKGPRFQPWVTISTTSPIERLKFLPGGDKLAVAEHSGISLWEIPSLEPSGIYRGHSKPARSLAFSRDGRTAASIASNGIHIWDVSTASGFFSMYTWPTETHWLQFVDDATLLTGDRGTPTYYCFGGEFAADHRFVRPTR